MVFFLIKLFYFICFERNLWDSEDKVSELFVKNMCNFEVFYVEFFFWIIGKKDFKSLEFCILFEFLLVDVYKVMLIFYFCLIVVLRIIIINMKIFVFMLYFVNLLKF